MTPNRVVAVLTPLLFAPLAGAVAAWLAKHFPGFNVDQKALEEIFIAGALIALAPAIQWLHGWQKYEAREAEIERDFAFADAAVEAGSAGSDDHSDLDESTEDDEVTGLDQATGLDAVTEAVEPTGLDELAELDELADLDELAEMDEFDEEMLSADADPALAGS